MEENFVNASSRCELIGEGGGGGKGKLRVRSEMRGGGKGGETGGPCREPFTDPAIGRAWSDLRYKEHGGETSTDEGRAGEGWPMREGRREVISSSVDSITPPLFSSSGNSRQRMGANRRSLFSASSTSRRERGRVEMSKEGEYCGFGHRNGIPRCKWSIE